MTEGTGTRFAILLGGQVPMRTADVESFWEEFPAVSAAFDRAAAVVGGSPRSLAFATVDESGERLQSRGAVQQSALVIGIVESLCDAGVEIESIGGMSLGGLVSSVIAGAVSEADLYGFLHHQRLAPPPDEGVAEQGMAVAVLRDGKTVDQLVDPDLEGVYLACDYDDISEDGAGVVVLSGLLESLRELVDRNSDCSSLLGGYVGGFHSPLVADVSAFMETYSETMGVTSPSIPLVTAQIEGHGRTDHGGLLRSGDDVKRFFIENYTCPVGTADLLRRLRAVGRAPVLGVGPGLPQTPRRTVSSGLEIRSLTTASGLREFLAGQVRTGGSSEKKSGGLS